MILLQDLGLFPVGTNGNKVRKGLYLCPDCLDSKCFSANMPHVNSGRTSRCRSCSIKHKAIVMISKLKDVFAERVSMYSDGSVSLISEYNGDTESVTLQCNICGLIFTKLPASIRRDGKNLKCKCQRPKNKDGNFKYTFDKWATLYLVKFNSTNMYKIGITTGTIHKRVSKLDRDYTVEHTYTFPIASQAYTVEQWILSYYSDYLYTGDKLYVDGNTELLIKYPTDFISVLDLAIESTLGSALTLYMKSVLFK